MGKMILCGFGAVISGLFTLFLLGISVGHVLHGAWSYAAVSAAVALVPALGTYCAVDLALQEM